ncbi:MAG TPA: glycosyltransferase [Clostridia bacterium]|nr:glycosyltransferase [Clostridia bacterium]
MSKCLIIITSQYPYLYSEPFLENEITYHTKNFEKILIFPLDISKKDKPKRTLPNEAESINTAVGRKVTGRAKDVLNATLNCFKKSEHYNSDKNRVGKSFAKRMFLEYFVARSKRHFEAISEALSEIDLSRFDDVVIYSYWMFATAQVAVLLKEKLIKDGKNVSLFTRAHRYDLYEYANALKYLPLREKLLSEFDEIYPCSKDGEEYLAEMFGKMDKIKVSYLGTSDAGVGSYDNVFRIMSCSRAVPVKRIEKIINSLALLSKSNLEIEWTHIGDGGELKKLKALAQKKLGFMSFHFVGNISNSEVLEYYKTQNVSLFVNTSSSEGLPVSIMEAISFGIPVVATDVGGTKEIVINDVTGKLLDEEFSDNELANEIKKYATLNENEYQNLRNSCRRFWEDNFCAELNFEKFSNRLTNYK